MISRGGLLPYAAQDQHAWDKQRSDVLCFKKQDNKPRVLSSHDIDGRVRDSSMVGNFYVPKPLPHCSGPKPYLKRHSKTVRMKYTPPYIPKDTENHPAFPLSPLLGGGHVPAGSIKKQPTLKTSQMVASLGLQHKKDIPAPKGRFKSRAATSHFDRSKSRLERVSQFEAVAGGDHKLGLHNLFGDRSGSSCEPRRRYMYCTKAYGSCSCPDCRPELHVSATDGHDRDSLLKLFCEPGQRQQGGQEQVISPRRPSWARMQTPGVRPVSWGPEEHYIKERPRVSQIEDKGYGAGVQSSMAGRPTEPTATTRMPVKQDRTSQRAKPVGFRNAGNQVAASSTATVSIQQWDQFETEMVDGPNAAALRTPTKFYDTIKKSPKKAARRKSAALIAAEESVVEITSCLTDFIGELGSMLDLPEEQPGLSELPAETNEEPDSEESVVEITSCLTDFIG